MSPPLPIRLLPEARDELDAAVDWYEQQRPGLGTAFLDRVQEVLARIAAKPQLHAVVYQDVRKAVVQKFPYLVLYKEEAARYWSLQSSTALATQPSGRAGSEATSRTEKCRTSRRTNPAQLVCFAVSPTP